MVRIYCVEDDKNIQDLLVYALKNNGFDARGFSNGSSFFVQVKKDLPNLILLDIMLPDIDGISILNTLKEDRATQAIPVIILTAKSSEYDKVIGLDLGADDYIVKPFSVMETIARIKALLRRTDIKKDEKQTIFKLGDVFLNYQKRVVEVEDKSISLTFKEFELLYYLLENKNIVLSRDIILNKIWDYDYEGETRTVDVHIRSLRQKLGKSGVLIQTIRNVGYKIGENNEKEDI